MRLIEKRKIVLNWNSHYKNSIDNVRVCFMSDSKSIMYFSNSEPYITIFNIQKNKVIMKISNYHADSNVLLMSPFGQYFISGQHNEESPFIGRITRWDCATLQQTNTFQLDTTVAAGLFTSEDQAIVSTLNGQLAFMDFRQKEITNTINIVEQKGIYSLTHRDNTLVVPIQNQIRLYDIRNIKKDDPFMVLKSEEEDRVVQCIFNPKNANELISSGYHQRICKWDINGQTYQCICEGKYKQFINQILLTQNNQILFSLQYHIVQLMDTSEECSIDLLWGTWRSISQMDMSHSKKYIVVGTFDGSVVNVLEVCESSINNYNDE